MVTTDELVERRAAKIDERVAEFDIMYDEGISRAGDLLDMAVEVGMVKKRGSYYYRDDESLAQGRENAKQYLRETPDVAGKIEAAVREHLALGSALPLTIGEEEAGLGEIEEAEAVGEPDTLELALELEGEDDSEG